VKSLSKSSIFDLLKPNAASRLAPLPLRLIVGYGFFAHGFAKLEKGPERFVAIVDALGVPLPGLMAWAAILVELVGGAAMIMGAFVPWLILPMMMVLFVALVTVHFPFGFTSIKLMSVGPDGPKFGPPGMETDLLYMACLAALALAGPGPFALDTWLAKQAGKTRV
jgi:putative oxidoreductase